MMTAVTRAGGGDSLLHFGAKSTPQLEIHISFSEGVNQYEVALAPTDTDGLFPIREAAHFWDKAQHPAGPFKQDLSSKGLEAGISDRAAVRTANWVRRRLARWRAYHFHDTSPSSPMKKTADLEDNRFLRADGSNLAAFLFLLQQKHDAEYGLIRGTIRRIAPFFDDFELEASALNPDKIRLQWRHQGSDKYFDAASLSDGTLRFITLTTLLLQPEDYRPSVVLVDEPLGGWLEDYSLGQLWEKNQLGGRPRQGG